jgi:triacylglycerol lipase
MPREINFPVVLIHGFSDFPGLSGSWVAVEKVLREEAGVPKSDILTVQIPPLASIEERTKSAISAISAKFSGKSVHLIAHSMGGLNARDIAARSESGTNELKFKVLTVTTFGTPHYGIKALDSNAFVGAVVKIFGTIAPALIDMKPDVVAQFNKDTKVNSKVKYFTWAGSCTIGTVLFAPVWPFTIVHGATDCVINVSSAKWDPGCCTQLGVIQGADHFTLLSKKTTQYTIPHLKAAENGERAPVMEIENTLASAVATRLKGDIHTLTAPGRAFFALFG